MIRILSLFVVSFLFHGFVARTPATFADTIQFQVTGNGGVGLVGGNVNPVPPTNPGSGGLGSAGITFDTETNLLRIDIKWGSANGFADLTGVVTFLHLHGMTADPAPGSFNQTNSNILINLGNSPDFDESPMSGGLDDIFFVGNPDVQGLLEGRTYINVHTDENEMGEIRGYLVVVPEPGPSSLLLVVLFGSCIFLFARRRSSFVCAPVRR